MRQILMILSCHLIIGCTHYTLTQSECEHADWFRIGVEDGISGHSKDRAQRHEVACERFSIGVDKIIYNKGHDQGVVTFCNPQNGYRVGIRGDEYQYVCPKDSEPAFLAEYKKGYQIYSVKSEYSEMKWRMRHVLNELGDQRTKLLQVKTSEERFRLVSNINDLEQEKETLTQRMRLFEIQNAQILTQVEAE